ncbi:hypothetical protein C8J57DRAFT_1508094 [Mycena rebaudengoi]|nr:hypothetical protein C8J57DRAFT_1508094 [Mycena rebaudengoi]
MRSPSRLFSSLAAAALRVQASADTPCTHRRHGSFLRRTLIIITIPARHLSVPSPPPSARRLQRTPSSTPRQTTGEPEIRRGTVNVAYALQCGELAVSPRSQAKGT